uniref:Uncharacterized protein n=1 Tax=Vitis vinifera TaxID=29760 RepID=F6H587_VITVI
MELVDQKDKHGRTSLHYAASIGYLEGVQTLLGQSNFDQYQRDDEGFSPIHVASMRGNVDIVKELLQNLINEKDKGGNTPLHSATMHAHPKVVNYLTWDKRVDVNLVNNEGQTVFDIAVSVEHPTSFHQTNLDNTQVYWCTTSRKFKGPTKTT